MVVGDVLEKCISVLIAGALADGCLVDMPEKGVPLQPVRLGRPGSRVHWVSGVGSWSCSWCGWCERVAVEAGVLAMYTARVGEVAKGMNCCGADGCIVYCLFRILHTPSESPSAPSATGDEVCVSGSVQTAMETETQTAFVIRLTEGAFCSSLDFAARISSLFVPAAVKAARAAGVRLVRRV